MHVHIEEQIAKLQACTATSTIRPWVLISIMVDPNKNTLVMPQMNVNTYLTRIYIELMRLNNAFRLVFNP